MADPDLIIEAGFSDAKLTQSVQQVVAKYKAAGTAAQKAFQDATGKVSDSSAVRAHMRKLDELKRAYDPVYTATKRYEAEVGKLNQALKIGAISSSQYAAETRKVTESFGRTAGLIDNVGTAVTKTAGATRNYGGSLQQIGFQVGDFATQVGAGASATQALGQQLPQLLGAFGTFGALAGAGAAVLIPLGAALLKTAMDSGTLEDRMKALEKSTDAMTEAAAQAAIPVETLRQKYGDLADEVARANDAAAAFAAIQAQSDLAGAAGMAAAGGRLAVGGQVRDRSAPGGYRDATNDERRAAVIARLADEYGATAEQAEKLYQAQRRLETATGPEAIAKDAENLLAVWMEIGRNVDAPTEKINGFAASVQAVFQQAARQVEAQRSEVAKLLETYDETTAKMRGFAGELERAEGERAKASAAGKTEEVAQWDRVIAKIREMVYETRAAAQETDTLFERMTKSAQGFIAAAAGRAGEFMSSQGFEDRYIQERARGAGSQNEEAVRAATAAAEQLGVAAKDMLTVMSFESGINPGRYGGKGGKYLGLIQFSPDNQQRYGVNKDQSISEQMGSVVRYLKDTGVKPGMGLENIYAAILAGDARKTNASDRVSGGIVDNVGRDVRGTKFAPHINRAEGLLAAYPDAVLAQTEADKASAQAVKEQADAREKAAQQVKEYADTLARSLVTEQQRTALEQQRADAIARINATDMTEADKAAAIAQVNAEMQKQLSIMALMEDAKRRGVDIDAKMIGSAMTYREAINALGEAQKQQSLSQQEVKSQTKEASDAQKFYNDQQRQFEEGMVDSIIAGEGFAEVLKNLALQMAKAALQAALFGSGPTGGGGGLLSGIFGGLFGGGGGGLFGGQAKGYASGGYTGSGSRNQPAGIVHAGEYVMSAPAVQRIGLPNLEAMHRGGSVGGGSSTVTFSPVINAVGAVSQSDLEMAKRQMAEFMDKSFVPALRKHMPNFNARYT